MNEDEIKMMQENFYKMGFEACVLKLFKYLEGKVNNDELVNILKRLLWGC